MLARALSTAAALMMSATATMAQPSLCEPIVQLIARTAPGDAATPLFIPSYERGDSEEALPLPIAQSAFSYDNALAIMALVSCHEVQAARRIGDAFLSAMATDRTFNDGRIRNAYRAGVVRPGPQPLPGWWDDRQQLWAEDAYQDGSQTGNVAWVGLSLLALGEATGEPRYREGARQLGRWIAGNAVDQRPPGGVTGGVAGFDAAQTPIRWKSTEHNLDAYALGAWIARDGSEPAAERLVNATRPFLDAMFDSATGGFRMGTLPDGQPQPTHVHALDALIWPLLAVADPPADWRRALALAKARLAVAGGYDFNGDRDGLWTEGTAQAALVERSAGNRPEANRLLAVIERFRAPSGLLYATEKGRISTGLAIGETSKEADFFYFHRPHLGATAWAALARTGLNPFTGKKVD